MLTVNVIECDVVSLPFGKGKVTDLSVLEKHDNLRLHLFWEQNVHKVDVIVVGRHSVNLLYRSTSQMSLNALRHDIFTSLANTPKLPILPPLAAQPDDSPNVKFGWKYSDGVPQPVYGIIAQKQLLKVVACSAQWRERPVYAIRVAVNLP